MVEIALAIQILNFTHKLISKDILIKEISLKALNLENSQKQVAQYRSGRAAGGAARDLSEGRARLLLIFYMRIVHSAGP